MISTYAAGIKNVAHPIANPVRGVHHQAAARQAYTSTGTAPTIPSQIIVALPPICCCVFNGTASAPFFWRRKARRPGRLFRRRSPQRLQCSQDEDACSCWGDPVRDGTYRFWLCARLPMTPAYPGGVGRSLDIRSSISDPSVTVVSRRFARLVGKVWASRRQSHIFANKINDSGGPGGTSFSIGNQYVSGWFAYPFPSYDLVWSGEPKDQEKD